MEKPVRPCIFAVSRRFNVPAIESLNKDLIEPILELYGIPLTCTYASDDPDHPDHWVGRMGMIFDLSDVHVIVDIERSGNTLYEFESSNMVNHSSQRLFLNWFLGLQCSQQLQIFRVIVHDQEGRYAARSPSYYPDPLRRLFSRFRGSTILVRYDRTNPSDFQSSFREAIETVCSTTLAHESDAIKRQRYGGIREWLTMGAYRVADESDILLAVEDFTALRLAIAKIIATGVSPVEVAREIVALGDRSSVPIASRGAANDVDFFGTYIVHDPVAMSEFARTAIEFGGLAEQALKSGDDLAVRVKVLRTALALRLSLLFCGDRWRRSSFLEMHAGLLRLWGSDMIFGMAARSFGRL